MARRDNPRPGRRSSRFVALVLGTALVGWAGVALSAAATRPATSPLVDLATSPLKVIYAPPPDLSPEPAPAATPAPPVSEPPSRAAVRAVTVRYRLQAELDSIRTRLGIPGVSVTILFRDGTSWTGTSGQADVGAKAPVSADTAFAIGSISKTYTAALILALVDDGKIQLDAPAVTYLPGAKLDKRITVRQLLNHTSGLDDFFLHPPIDKALLADRAAVWSASRALKYVAKPYFPPGRGWHYSNTNYLYLGLIAERVTGVSLATALRDRFFDPLGLDRTWYQAAEDPRSRIAHGYRFANSSKKSPPIDLSDGTSVAPFTSVVTAAAGAGSIAATSGDLATWARLLYNGDVLGPTLTAQMLDGVAATAGYNPRVPYGLGVQAFPIEGRLSIGHSGRLLGFRAAVRHIPGEALTIAVLTNQSRADPGVIVQDLLSVVFAPDAAYCACQRAN